MLTLIVPVTLRPQKKYIWKPRQLIIKKALGWEELTTVVRFLNYDPCPAVVYILDAKNCKRRIARDELFEFLGPRKTVSEMTDLQAKTSNRISTWKDEGAT